MPLPAPSTIRTIAKCAGVNHPTCLPEKATVAELRLLFFTPLFPLLHTQRCGNAGEFAFISKKLRYPMQTIIKIT
jgi:hypothetical protein